VRGTRRGSASACACAPSPASVAGSAIVGSMSCCAGGFAANHKLVHRLSREEKLAIRRRGRQKRGLGAVMAGSWCPVAANQRWSLAFTEDRLADGRRFRTANLKDDCTREGPAILVDFSLPGRQVVGLLEDVARERGYPDVLVVDNGPVLRGRDLDQWGGGGVRREA
jgi:putative transposase